ncbi:MAG: PTS mannose transporter subunit IIAB [Firmicutes bacterium]|nr:PTS mannose transporter subunit IIAB [Bacillota bacterium]
MREITNENLIDLNLKAFTRTEAIRKLSLLLKEQGLLSSLDLFLVDVLKREQEETTGFGMGFAIPHGKSKAVKETAVAVGRLAAPVEWKSLDDQPVEMIFLLAVPEAAASTDHLVMLSRIAGVLMEDDFREQLLAAQQPREVIDLMNIKAQEDPEF